MNRIQNLSVNEIFVQVHKTALFAAIEKRNIDIVKMLLMNNKVDIDDAKHIYNINNYKIQWCSILPIFLKETKNLFKAIFFIKDKCKPDEQSKDAYPNFATSWVSMYQS